ncbi:MAG: hypothetical protein J6Q74_00685 [Clostridia bacterium]|nr:hypothetical protein [Clostridia bacterium]
MRFVSLKSDIKNTYIKPEEISPETFKNLMIKDKKIVTREGFYSKEGRILFKLDNSGVFDMSFMLTDCYINFSTKKGRVAVSIADNLMGSIIFFMTLICDDGEVLELGQIEFTNNGESYGYPDSFTVFSGKKTVADGVYLIYRRLYENGEEFIGIRELDFLQGVWRVVSDSDIYAPTVYANGRGELYHFAEVNGRELRLPSPTFPEKKNLLCPRFVAKYTTDGVSYGFSLPYTELDDSLVSASLRINGEQHDFKVYGGGIQSASVTVLGQEVVMYANRSFGRIHFEKKSGGEWIPPISSEYNNLTVTAYKTEEGHKAKIAAMTAAKKLEGSISANGDAVTVFYKSQNSPAAIIANSPKEPLYFPEDSQYILGDDGNKVCNILVYGKSLLVFKDGSIYKSDIKPYNDDGKYPLSFIRVSDIFVDIEEKTIGKFLDKIIFADKTGRIFEMKPSADFSTRQLFCFDAPFDHAIAQQDKYLFIKDKNAVVLQKNGEKYIFGEWELPDRCIGGISDMGKAVFFLEKTEGGDYFIYPSWLYGDADFSLSDGGAKKEQKQIESSLSFNLLEDFGRTQVCEAEIFGQGMEIVFSVFNRGKKAMSRRVFLHNGYAKMLLGGISDRHKMRISFKGRAELTKIGLKYKKKG